MLRTDHSSTSRQPAAPRFHSVSRSGIRRPHRRHPYAHHIRSLSGAIRRLIAELDLSECLRVLRPGGRMLLSTHGVFPYHPDPVDLWRWTCEGLRREVEQVGFEVVRFEGVIGMAATGLQLLQDSISYRMSDRWISWL